MPHTTGSCRLKYGHPNRSELLAFYYRDHDVVEDRLESIKVAILSDQIWSEENRQIIDSFTQFLRHELENHLIEEEQILFPQIAEVLGQANGPISLMNGEHQTLRSLVDELVVEVESCKMIHQKTNRLIELLYQVDEFLADHMYKENCVLFPMAEQILTDFQKAQVLHALQARRETAKVSK
ncbi:hemerythrin domain-containing protein [Brevibacillus sp. SYSU BS000544]|uniref:hemerythrin domain-containing protein n=1 Tax=Brevibacillus sp. SYSU BS000544 TaxID=3416443 RepID=UPI003CE462A5